MVWGRKSNDSRASSGQGISGHLDEWTSLAVDYVDGTIDDSTKSAIQAHLQTCPDCARRLTAQQSALAFFAQARLVEAPEGLEAQVLGQALGAAEAAPAVRPAARRRAARRSRALLNPAGPWLPAMAGGAAVLALVLAMTISRDAGGQDLTMTTAADVFSSEASATLTPREASADVPSTTSPALTGSGSANFAPTDSAGTLTGANTSLSAPPLPTGTNLQDRAAMVSGLSQASAPAYFFFDTKDGGLVTTEQAETVASELTAATGLRAIDQQLSSGVKAFAAFVPRGDSAAVVDLLRSLSDSLQLSVSLSLQPGAEVTSWAASMLQDKYSLAELSASPSRPPVTTDWVYTTSTSPPTTYGTARAPKTTLLDEAGTHVLVVIFVAVRN
jgi:hypothetical protein